MFRLKAVVGWDEILNDQVCIIIRAFLCIHAQRKNKVDFLIKKESRRNCCNSPAARRVPKNADSICKQSNREASGTQDFVL